VNYADDSKWTMARLESVGESRADERWPVATSLRAILGLALVSWIVVGLAAYEAVEIFAR